MKRGPRPKVVPVAELRHWRAKGWTQAELGHAFGVSVSTIRLRLQDSGGDSMDARKLKRKPPPVRDREIRAWRAKGWSLRHLGYAFGLSFEWVRVLLAQEGDPKPVQPPSVAVDDVFGRLTVEAIGPNRMAICRCECGNRKVIAAKRLPNGARSCGCLKREKAAGDRRVQITIGGRTQHLSAWLRELRMDYRTVSLRVKAGWSYDEALSRPLQCGRRLDGQPKAPGGTKKRGEAA